jgi:hypothetical protein
MVLDSTNHALRGVSVSEAAASPTCEVVLPQPPETKWELERRAFLRLAPSLLPKHRGQYVAVHEGKVVDSGLDKVAVGLRAYARYGYIPIYVGLVTDELPTIDRLPTPRPVRREALP